MMYYGGYGAGWGMMWGFGSLTMLLVLVNLVLLAIWLWKQIKK